MSVPIEEYEIRDVSRRSDSPDLRLTCEATQEPSSQDASNLGPPTSLRVRLMHRIINEAATPAEYAVILVFIDSRLQILQGGSDLKPSGDYILEVKEGLRFPCARLQVNWGIPGKLPIFQSVRIPLLANPLLIGIPDTGRYVLGWQIFSPRMVPRLDVSFLVWAENKALIADS